MVRDARSVPAAVLFVVLALAPGLALAGGPPTLALEAVAPGSPAAAKGAAFVLRAMQCGSPVAKPVEARAEGLVDGKRVSAPITLARTSQAGVYLIERTWPATGSWALVFTVESHGRATLLARAGEDGRVASRLTHEAPTPAAIDDAVRGRLALASR